MTRKRAAKEGDIVLIHLEEQPASFARIDAIRAHERPGWYYCDLLVLAVPPQPMTWILEREQIDGAGFTMGGRPVRIERIPDLGVLHTRRTGEDAAPATLTLPRQKAAVDTPRGRPSLAKQRRPARNVVQLFPRKPHR